MPTPRWSSKILADEPVLLTVHESGVASELETNGCLYLVHCVDGVFKGFYDPSDETVYRSASALCKAKLQRHGPKNTNQWRGPRHCLVLRNGVWKPLDKI